jgi:hypothetical protein
VALINQKNIKIITFAFAFILLLSGIFFGLNIYDEGVALVGAEHVRQGHLPYQDFWTMYAPGQYYLLAGWLEVFPDSVLSGRVMSILILFAYTFLAYRLSTKSSSDSISIMVLIVAVVWLNAFAGYGRALSTAMMLSLLTILTFLKFLDQKKIKYLLFCGLLVGLTGIFRHDIGAYLFISIGLTIFLTKGDLKKGKSFFFLLLSTFITAFILLAYFLINIPIETLYEMLIETPSTIFKEYRSLPYPIPFIGHDFSGVEPSVQRRMLIIWDSIVFYIPLIIYIYSIIKQFKDRNALRLLLTIFGLALYNQTTVRADIEHLLPTFIVSIILAGTYLNKTKLKTFGRVAILVVVIGLITVPMLRTVKNLTSATKPVSNTAGMSERLNGVFFDDENFEYYILMVHLNKHYATKGKFWIGCLQHDKIYVNNVALYYIMNIDLVTKYTEMHPGVATTEKVQKEIIEEIESNDINTIILYKNDDIIEPNKSSESSGVTLLDDHIRVNYKIIIDLDKYRVLVKE